MEGSVILMEPPMIGAIATPLHKPASAASAGPTTASSAKYAAAGTGKAATGTTAEDEARKASISSVTRSELVRNGTASALMPSVRESHAGHAHSTHNSRPSSATPHDRASTTGGQTNNGASNATPASDLLVAAAAAAAAATAAAAAQGKKDRKAQRAVRREEKAARLKDKESSSSSAGGVVPVASSTVATAASSSDAAASAAHSDIDGEDTTTAAEDDPALSRPAGLRRQLSLEDEADERTARSLRNFEAEHVLAATALQICTFFPHREHAHSASTAVTGSAHPGSSPHESRSPSESPRPGYNAHRPARLQSGTGTSTPGSTHSSHALASPTHVVFNTGGAISPSNGVQIGLGSVAMPPYGSSAALSPSHTPGGSSTPQPQGPHLMVSAPYVNPDILDDSAVIFTPTGKRTALALLMTGNNSARTSPRGPQGLKPSVSLPFGFPTLAGQSQGLVSFSKTVPNSPRSYSPVHAPSKLGVAAGPLHTGSALAPPERAASASRLLAVPGGSMLAPPSVSTAAPGSARLSRATIQARLAPKRAGTLTLAQQQEASAAAVAGGYTRSQSGALQSYQPSQQPYSRSVQTSPKHSRSSTAHLQLHSHHHHAQSSAAAAHVGVPRNFPVLHGSDPPSPVDDTEECSGLAGASATASIAAGVWSTATGEELFERRPHGPSNGQVHRRTNTGGAASVGHSGSTTPNPSAPPSARGPSASLLRFQARLKSANHARTAPDLEADALVTHRSGNVGSTVGASGEEQSQEEHSAGPYLPRARRNSRG